MKLQRSTFGAALACLLLSLFLLGDSAFETDSMKFLNAGYAVSSARRIIFVPDDFERIQDAINNSTDGDIVLVKPGTYKGGIVINRSISLMGVNKSTTILDSETKSDAVTINENNVVFTGFTIKNGNFPAQFGVNINNRVNATVQYNIIVNNFVGIKLYRATSNTVKWNQLSNNRYGIFLSHSARNVVFANNITANEWNGIELDWSDQNVIEANTVSSNKAYGFEIPTETPAQDNIVFHNNFFNN